MPSDCLSRLLLPTANAAGEVRRGAGAAAEDEVLLIKGLWPVDASSISRFKGLLRRRLSIAAGDVRIALNCMRLGICLGSALEQPNPSVNRNRTRRRALLGYAISGAAFCCLITTFGTALRVDDQMASSSNRGALAAVSIVGLLLGFVLIPAALLVPALSLFARTVRGLAIATHDGSTCEAVVARRRGRHHIRRGWCSWARHRGQRRGRWGWCMVGSVLVLHGSLLLQLVEAVLLRSEGFRSGSLHSRPLGGQTRVRLDLHAGPLLGRGLQQCIASNPRALAGSGWWWLIRLV